MAVTIDNKKYLKLLSNYDNHCLRIAQASSIDIKESSAEKLNRIKGLEKDYIVWIEYYFPHYCKKKSAKFHRELAEDIIKNKHIYELAEMYRSAGKSVHIDLFIPLYLYLVKKELFFMLLIGETEEKAAQLLSGIQAELEYNKRLIADYGQKKQVGSWSDGNFTTSDGVKFMSLGFGQNPRGVREQAQRPDYIVVDDVDSKKHVNNDMIMRESVDYITEDIWGCFDTDDDAIERFVFANNNFHKNSITNRLHKLFAEKIQQQKDERKAGFKHRIKYKILRVCAVLNLTDFTPTWPEKTSAEYWRAKYASMPYRSFMREYMHVHIEEGKIFKDQNIHYIRPKKKQFYDEIIMYGDLSYKQNADYKALVFVGKYRNQFHVLHTYMRQLTRTDAAKWLYNLYESKNLEKYNISYFIEGLFSMDEFVSDFDLEGDERGYIIPVQADKRSKANKFDRIESMAGFFEKNLVYFSTFDKGADQTILIDQLLSFEKGSGTHDDGPDALQSAIAYLNRATHSRDAEYAFAERTNQRY